jgi:hypothetical protein
MLHLLPFVAGLVTGAVTIKLLRNDKTSQTLENTKVKTSETLANAKARIREATVSGLSRLEASSAAMREKLTVVEAAPEAATPDEAPAPAPAKKATRPRKAGTGAKRAAAAGTAGEPVAGEAE